MNIPPSFELAKAPARSPIFSPASAILSLSDWFSKSVWSSASNTLSSSFVITCAFSKSVLNPNSSAVLLSPAISNSVFTAVAFVSCLLSCPSVTSITDKKIFLIS